MVTEVHLTLPFGGKLRSPREGKKQTSASWEGPGSPSEQVPLRRHSSTHPCLQSPVHNLLHPLPPPILIAHPEPFYPEPPKPSLPSRSCHSPTSGDSVSLPAPIPHLGTEGGGNGAVLAARSMEQDLKVTKLPGETKKCHIPLWPTLQTEELPEAVDHESQPILSKK